MAPRSLLRIIRSLGTTHPWLVVVFCLLCQRTTGWAAEAQVVRGHVPAAVAGLAPIGRLDPASHLQLALGLQGRDPEGLARFIQELADPASPHFRQYLTPAQFTETYGPTKEDYQKVIDFAKANGLKVTQMHPNRVVLSVEGSVANIEKALHVTFRTYRHPEEARVFHSVDKDPSLDLSVPLLHIGGLDDFSLPQSKMKPIPAGIVPRSKGSAPGGSYGPADLRAAYVPGTTLTGAGQNVGLLQFAGYAVSDITAYRTKFGLASVPLVNVLVNGGPKGSKSNGEVCLDIEMVMALAPGVSKIYVYEAPNGSNWEDLLNRMTNDNLCKQLSCSWGGGGPNPTAEMIFQQMAAQGQSFFDATGDSDAFPAGQKILFPSESPNITQVGGTTLTTSGPGGSYVSETAWNWGHNEGTSGGISITYPIPSWQQGISMTASHGSTSKRNIPDVALTADNIYNTFGKGKAQTVGGTSCAAPLWAAFTALVNQKAVASGKPVVGFINPAIYQIATGGSYTADFHDTKTGNNFNTASPTDYSAVTGYDLCTGWGTPVGTALINALAIPPPADPLQVPNVAFASGGPQGGPFSPTSTSYALTNNSSSSLSWTAATDQTWFTVSPKNGTLGPGAGVTVTVSLTPAANSLAAATYTGSTTFTDVTSGVALVRGATLQIAAPSLYYFSLDTDPGWTRQGQWAYGKPAGKGGQSLGFHDPKTGATGTNVFGINLKGDYSSAVGSKASYLTTNALNLTNSTGTLLRFQRWLNTDYQPYVRTTVEVSNDGTHWTVVFFNSATTPIIDSSWQSVQYDISAVADNHSTVYIRWGHWVESSQARIYSGWNIDDIEIVSTPAGASAIGNLANRASSPATISAATVPDATASLIVAPKAADATAAATGHGAAMPSGFAAVPTPGATDVNPGGSSNLALFNAASGATQINHLKGAASLGSDAGPVVPAGWKLVDVADIDGDGNEDYVLYNPSTQATAIWYLNGATLLGSVSGPTIAAGYDLVATADFNADGQRDFVLWNRTTQQTAVWFMNNNVFVSAVNGPTLPAGFGLAGVADFDGDSNPDFALFNPSTHATAIDYLSGAALLWSADGPAIGAGFTLGGIADLNGDGRPDFILLKTATGETAFWYMSATTRIGGAKGPTLPAGYSLVAP